MTIRYEGDDESSATSSAPSRSATTTSRSSSPGSPLGAGAHRAEPSATSSSYEAPGGAAQGRDRRHRGLTSAAGEHRRVLSATAARSRSRRRSPRLACPPADAVELPDRGTTFVREPPGPPGAPTLVLLHGWTANSELNWFTTYDALGEHFRGGGHRPPGPRSRHPHLASLPPRPTAPTTSSPSPTRSASSRFVPVGYSMGGPIAQLTWHRHRDRVAGLVLCATAAATSQSAPDRARGASGGSPG